MPGLNPDCLHSLDVEQITASFLQAFARQRERLRRERQQELRQHRQLVRLRQERQVRVQQLELVQVLRQERVREQALLLFCHKR